MSPEPNDENDRELRVCRDTLRATVDAMESLAAQLEREALRCRELAGVVACGPAPRPRSDDGPSFAASRAQRGISIATTNRDRIDWLLTAMSAVEDLVRPKLQARRALPADDAARARDDELEACLEELRVAAEELRAQRERLRIERQRYAELFDLAPDPYLEADARWNVREANRAAMALLACDHGALVGQPLAELVAPGRRMELRSRMLSLTEGAEAEVAEFETLVQPRAAAAVAVVVRASALRDAHGRVQGICCVLRRSC